MCRKALPARARLIRRSCRPRTPRGASAGPRCRTTGTTETGRHASGIRTDGRSRGTRIQTRAYAILTPLPLSEPSVATAPRRRLAHPALRMALLALGFRLVSAVVAFYANVVFPLYDREPFTMFGKTSPFWDTFARFDAGWYYPIAKNGYQYVEGGRNNLAYFPVYPLLMRYVGRLFGPSPADYLLGGIVVSWAALVLAMIALAYLARLNLPR